jgi:hypothetical protein
MRNLARFTSSVVLCLLALGFTAIHQEVRAQDPPTPAGHWEGAILVPDAPIEINIDLMVDEEGVWSGDISIPAQMAEDFPLADVAVEGSKVSFRMAEVPGDPTFTGTMSDDGKTISGTFTQGGGQVEFSLTRKDPREGAAGSRHTLLKP